MPDHRLPISTLATATVDVSLIDSSQKTFVWTSNTTHALKCIAVSLPVLLVSEYLSYTGYRWTGIALRLVSYTLGARAGRYLGKDVVHDSEVGRRQALDKKNN